MSDYKVGIELLLASNAEQILGVMASKLLGVHGRVEDLEGGFGRLKLAIGGAFAIGGAVAMLGVMDKLIKKGAELENQMYRLSTAGFTPKQAAQVRANAGKVASQFPNLTEGELVKLTGETTAVYGDPAVAIKNLSTAAAYLSAVKYRHPEDPEGAVSVAEDAIFKILRSEEMRGLAQDPKEVRLALAATLKGQETFGDTFDPNTSFQAVRYGRLASRYLSDRFVEGPGLVLAQELGGSNFGNSLNMVMNGLIGGHITKTALNKLEQVGIINPKKVKLGPHGTFDLANAVPQQKLLQTDPDIWFSRIFAPKVDKFAHGNLDRRDQVLRQLFQRTTAQQMAEILGWQTGPGGRITKDVNRLNQAMAPEDAVRAAMGNLATTTQSLNTQFDRLMTNLGQPAAHVAGKAAGALVGPVKNAADAAGAHPKASGAVDAILGVGGLASGALGLNMLYKAAKPLLARLGLLKGLPEGSGLFGDFVASPVAKMGVGAARIAAPAIEASAAAIGGVVAAIAALPAEAIAGITAGVIGLGVGIFEAWQHWDKSKDLAGNVSNELRELGDAIAGLSARARGVLGGPATASRSSVTAPPHQTTVINFHHTTQLGTETIASEVTTFLAHAFGATSVGPARHDPQASLPSANWGYGQ